VKTQTFSLKFHNRRKKDFVRQQGRRQCFAGAKRGW